MTHDAQLEALLFYRSEPVSLKEAGKLLGLSDDALKEAVTSLRASLNGRGLTLIEVNETIELRTSSEASAFLEKIRKEELDRNLGKASLETLAIILYKGPIARSEIDYIRGVNSTFILRALLIRGLIERVQNPNDQRSFLYRPTSDLLGFLGITSIKELPDYATVLSELEAFSASLAEEAAAQKNADGDSE